MRHKDSVNSSLGAQARQACTLASSQNSPRMSGLGEIKSTSELVAVTSVFVLELEPQWVLSSWAGTLSLARELVLSRTVNMGFASKSKG